jgi:hypothetical protein
LRDGSWEGGCRLLRGDAREQLPPGPFDVIFHDPYSPANNGELWTVEWFKLLRERASENAVLATYSAAPATRVSMLLAGWYVGAGASTGTKGETTVAATKLELLAQDSPYLRTASAAAPQQPVGVTDLQLRLPVIDAPGTDLGNGVTVATPAAKVVPAGYRLAPGWATYADGSVGGTVPATLSLTLGNAASFGAFTPGVGKEYTAATTANVISTAGDAALSASGPVFLKNGAFTLASPLGVEISPNAWSGPVSNGPAAITFRQAIGSNEALRTGTYAATVTFSLSTTTP